LVDFHAETTREKEVLAYYLDGRACLVVGTHTHVQTADERILPQGTAYITDLGMTGVSGGIIGMDPKICLDRAKTQILYRMEVAKASASRPPLIKGVLAGIDKDSGRALSITRLSVPETRAT
jgi:calcineurin-like phosphoesterase